MTDCLLEARARVVHDLVARGVDSPLTVSIVEDVLAQRRWWVEQWPDGEAYVACLVAQDVQEALEASIGLWPLCELHGDAAGCGGAGRTAAAEVAPHPLRVTPDLGADPHWVCEERGRLVAPVGALPPARTPSDQKASDQ